MKRIKLIWDSPIVTALIASGNFIAVLVTVFTMCLSAVYGQMTWVAFLFFLAVCNAWGGLYLTKKYWQS